jgi:hypothetical protein
MQIQYIQKPNNLLYVWVFFPTFTDIPEKIVHEIEHRLFFHKDFLDFVGGNHLFSHNCVEANGNSFYSGLRLEFFCFPHSLPSLLILLEKLSKDPLPQWSKAESERFYKEIECDDSFIKLILFYQEKILKLNKKNNISADKAWKNQFDFLNTRILVVGNISEESFLKNQKWEKNYNQKPDTHFSQHQYLDWYEESENYNYNIFFAEEATPKNYVCIKIMQNIWYEALTKQYVETGRSYKVTLKNHFEQNLIMASFDIFTHDTSPEKPKAPSKISESYFYEILKRTIFEELSNEDAQSYEHFPIIGFLPDDIHQAFAHITFSQFQEFYTQKAKEVSMYWC